MDGTERSVAAFFSYATNAAALGTSMLVFPSLGPIFWSVEKYLNNMNGLDGLLEWNLLLRAGWNLRFTLYFMTKYLHCNMLDVNMPDLKERTPIVARGWFAGRRQRKERKVTPSYSNSDVTFNAKRQQSQEYWYTCKKVQLILTKCS